MRYRARTCKPPIWFVPKKVSVSVNAMYLSPLNKKFIEEQGKLSKIETKPKIEKQWTINSYRSGLIAIKIGVTSQWDDKGKHFTVTLLQVLDNDVIRYKSADLLKNSHGFDKKFLRQKNNNALVVGSLNMNYINYRKAYNNLFSEANVPPKRKLTRFFVTPDAFIDPGTPLNVSHFNVGQFIDVQAKTVDHGFQGVMKRWLMKGGPATHGTTKWHRRIGSISEGRSKGISKGRRFPGHMGLDHVVLHGLKIWRINPKYNVIYVHGHAIPGCINSYVRIYDTGIKRHRQEMLSNPPPMPTSYKFQKDETFASDIFKFNAPSIKFSAKNN